MVGVGRDLCGSSSPTPLPKQGDDQHADRKTHGANTRLPEETPIPGQPGAAGGGRKDGPRHAAQLQPRRHPAPRPLRPPEPLKPLLPLLPTQRGFKSRCQQAAGWWGARPRAAASRGPLGSAPRPAPGSVLAEEGVLPVSAEFLGVSPQACPRPFQASVQLRSRSSPSDLQHAGRGTEDTAQDAWELVLKTWASRDVARATLGLGGGAGPSRLHRPGQDRSGQGAQTSLHHCQQGKPSGVTEPETIRILPEAGRGSSPQPDRAEQPEYPGLGTNLPREQQRGGRSCSARGEGTSGLLASIQAPPTLLQNNPQTAKRSNFFPRQLWTCCC